MTQCSNDPIAKDVRIEEHQSGLYVNISPNTKASYSDITRYIKTLDIVNPDYAALKRAFTQSKGRNIKIGSKGKTAFPPKQDSTQTVKLASTNQTSPASIEKDIKVEEHQGYMYVTVPPDKEIGYHQVTGFIKTLNLKEVDFKALKKAYSESRGKSILIGPKGESDFTSQGPSSLAVEISEDKKTAYVTFYPKKSDDSITYRQIVSELRSKGVVRGHMVEEIKKLAKNAPHRKKVQVAQWLPPMDGIDGKLTYHVPVYKDLLPFLLEMGPDVPFDEINFIRIAKKGKLLISRVPPVKGVPGCTVTGEKIPYKKGENVAIKKNKYLTLSPDATKAYAAMDGQVIMDEDGKVTIRLVKVLKKTASSRELKFDGSILIQGDLDFCPAIIASGDIEIRGANQNVSLWAKGNILVKGPLLMYGGKKGKALKDFACATTNNTQIAARNIYVDKAVSQAQLEASEGVHMNPNHGTLIGGEIEAGREVVVGQLGNKKETMTIVRVATNEIQAKYNEVKKKGIEKKVQTIKGKFDATNAEYLKLDQERREFEGDSLPEEMDQKIKKVKEKKESLQSDLDHWKTELVRCKSYKPDFNLGEVSCSYAHAGLRLEMGASVREIKVPIDSPVRFLKRTVGIITEFKDMVKTEEEKKKEAAMALEESGAEEVQEKKPE